MTTKAQAKSRIVQAVHETAGDLHRLGFIEKRGMRQYDERCLAPMQQYDAGVADPHLAWHGLGPRRPRP